MFKNKIMIIKEFAIELNIPESTIRTWKRRGNIPAECFVVIGSTVFIKVEIFENWMMTQTIGG